MTISVETYRVTNADRVRAKVLASGMARRWKSGALSPDEIRTICMQAAERAVEKFDPSKGPLEGLVWAYCRTAIRHEESKLTSKHTCHPESMDFASVMPDTSMIDISETLRMALARLTDIQRQVVELRAQGYTYREIGAIRGTTKQAVGRIMLVARRRLMTLLRDEEL